MLLDTQNLFSDNQNITTGTIYSTNTVKFGKGDVSYLPLIIQAVSDFSKLESLNVQVQTSDSEDFENCTILAEANLLLADLKEGVRFPITNIPRGNKGYMRLAYIVTADEGIQEDTGKITAGVVAADEINYQE